MRLFKYFFWKLLFSIGRENELYNQVIYTPLKPQSKKLINNKLKELFKFAKTSTNYYRKKSPDKIIDRLTFKKASSDILADKYRENIDNYSIKLNESTLKNLGKIVFGRDFIFKVFTGGTSGSPLILYKNKHSFIEDAFLFIRGWKFMGYKTGDKVLVFYNSYYDYDLRWINKLALLSGIKLFFFESLDKETIKKLVREINTFKPDFIITFPSYINDTAITIRKENLVLNHISKGIEVSGESLFDHQRKNIEEIFKTKVYDSYGSIEFGMVAHECEYQNGMHLYEDIVFAYNEGKNLIFTRYDSFDMPIINYKIGDFGEVINEKCKCGISGAKLKKVEGRQDDFILLKNKRYYPSFFRQVLNSCNLKYNNAIVESNIIQNNRKGAVLNVILSNNNNKKEINEYLAKSFNKILHNSLEIKFPKKIKKRRKFRFIERKL